MFIDIVGFTSFASNCPPAELLGILSDLFCVFDDIMNRRNLLKIKTLGDGYMAASGVLSWRPDHASSAVLAANDVLQAIHDYNIQCDTNFQCRIGINSGNVVAGVLGTSQLTFDLWGDTVNVAARLESVSQAGKITVSQMTKELLERDTENQFIFEDRGKRELKGKGSTQLFFVKVQSTTTTSTSTSATTTSATTTSATSTSTNKNIHNSPLNESIDHFLPLTQLTYSSSYVMEHHHSSPRGTPHSHQFPPQSPLSENHDLKDPSKVKQHHRPIELIRPSLRKKSSKFDEHARK